MCRTRDTRMLCCAAGVDLGRIGPERHSLFCKISEVLARHNVNYSFPGFAPRNK